MYCSHKQRMKGAECAETSFMHHEQGLGVTREKMTAISGWLASAHFFTPTDEPKLGGMVRTSPPGISAASRIWSAPIGENSAPGSVL